MVGMKDPPGNLSSRASCGGAGPSRRVRLVVANRASSPDPPRPIQHPDERLVAAEAPGMVRKFAYGEVRFLLASTRPAEGNAPDLHHRRPPTGESGPAPHLTPFRFRRGQEALLSSYSSIRSTAKQRSRLLIRAPQSEVALCTTLGSSRRRLLSGRLASRRVLRTPIERSHPRAGAASSESTNLSDLKYDLTTAGRS